MRVTSALAHHPESTHVARSISQNRHTQGGLHKGAVHPPRHHGSTRWSACDEARDSLHLLHGLWGAAAPRQLSFRLACPTRASVSLILLAACLALCFRRRARSESVGLPLATATTLATALFISTSTVVFRAAILFTPAIQDVPLNDRATLLAMRISQAANCVVADVALSVVLGILAIATDRAQRRRLGAGASE